METFKKKVENLPFSNADYYKIVTPKGKFIYERISAYTDLDDLNALHLTKEFTRFSYAKLEEAFNSMEKHNEALMLNCNTRWYRFLKNKLTGQNKPFADL